VPDRRYPRDRYAGFGGRAGETHQEQSRQGALARPSKDVAWAAVEAECDFSLGVTRNPAAGQAAAAIPDKAWRKAKRMKGAQVAVCDYAPPARSPP
jgi:hypothetical protein